MAKYKVGELVYGNNLDIEILFYVKNVYEREQGTYYDLVSANQEFPIELLTPESFQIYCEEIVQVEKDVEERKILSPFERDRLIEERDRLVGEKLDESDMCPHEPFEPYDDLSNYETSDDIKMKKNKKAGKNGKENKKEKEKFKEYVRETFFRLDLTIKQLQEEVRELKHMVLQNMVNTGRMPMPVQQSPTTAVPPNIPFCPSCNQDASKMQVCGNTACPYSPKITC